MTSFDIRGIQKPKALKAVCDRAQRYVTTMADLGKPTERVVLSRSDYGDIWRAAVSTRDASLPPLDGLRLGDVRVDCGP